MLSLFDGLIYNYVRTQDNRVFYLLPRGGKMRENVSLVCTECESRNYIATRKKDAKERLTFRKYCPKCGKYTIHKEGK